MDNINIGLRTHDIQNGLYKFQDTLIDTNLRRTILIGKAASLASHLRGIQVVDNYTGLIALASKLGISVIELEKVLEILDDVRYIQVTGPKDQPTKIEVLINTFQTTYKLLGEKWESQNPAEFEKKMVSLIDQLSSKTLSLERLNDTYDLKNEESSVIMDIGLQGGLISSFNSLKDGQKMLYSPLYMEENPEKILNILSKHPMSQVKEALDILKKMPGFPVLNLENITNFPLLELMNSNVCPTPGIDASGGIVNFLFSPFTEAEDKQMLQHARYVVAAVRYGQKFSKISTLKAPITFLNSLIDTGYIGKKPHSDIKAQYAILRDCGLGRIEEPIVGRYRFYIADTDYAKNVVLLAKKMLLTDEGDFEPEISRGIVNEAWDLRTGLSTYEVNGYIPGSNNIKNINRVLNEKSQLRKSSNSQEFVNEMINKLFLGGEPDVF